MQITIYKVAKDEKNYKNHFSKFITDSDNKYLKELLESINVDLTKCAKPNYVD